MHIVFVDFRLVDHAPLLAKLASMGVSRRFGTYSELPVERSLQITDWGLSKPGRGIAEVPQSRVISPTLFNVHINDIELTLKVIYP